MLRFLFGILLLQAATVALVVIFGLSAATWLDWWPLLIALGVVALVAAFWFSMLATHLRREELEKVRAGFAKEREELRVKAEREKTRLVRRNQKALQKETRRTERRANVKVGGALSAAAVVGVFMVLTNFVTLGLLTITGAGGALGGYLLHRYQSSGTEGLRLPGSQKKPWERWLPKPPDRS